MPPANAEAHTSRPRAPADRSLPTPRMGTSFQNLCTESMVAQSRRIFKRNRALERASEELEDLRVDREAGDAVAHDRNADLGADPCTVPGAVERRRDARAGEVRVAQSLESVRDDRLVVDRLEADDVLDVDPVRNVQQSGPVRADASAREDVNLGPRERAEVPLREAVEVPAVEVGRLDEQLAEVLEVETLRRLEGPRPVVLLTGVVARRRGVAPGLPVLPRVVTAPCGEVVSGVVP